MAIPVLILGGTGEATEVARRLDAVREIAVTLSLAGRTRSPAEQPVPVISGGFGGADGLADHLRRSATRLLIDATHPYAATISRNAAEAAEHARVPILALRRPGWEAVQGDRWQRVASVPQAVPTLGDVPRTVLLTLGRQEVHAFEAAPQHDYVVRSVDPVEPPLKLPRVRTLLARGPFDAAAEAALLRDEAIDVLVTKNSGGDATYGKIAAARALGIAVVMVDRPALPDVASGRDAGELVSLALHELGLSAKRGE